jgi:hypothetical protein
MVKRGHTEVCEPHTTMCWTRAVRRDNWKASDAPEAESCEPSSLLTAAEPAPDGEERQEMITRFPAPWRIVEMLNGFAVEDATGKQIGVFYGRAPDIAGHTGIMIMDEAREMAIDFAKLPELLKRDGTAG